ncbi:MAG: TrkA family potassium uptake protein, partial [Anaerolineales bacterium]|nr:TrkA family potassium uptake protein [Anaerolineales bacterium]
MKTAVIGCGRLGSELAYRLYKRGHQVTVLDPRPEAFNRLPPDFQGRTLSGDLLSRDLMESADFAHTDSLAAVSDNDSVNAVVARVARLVYHIPNVVVRNYDPSLRPLLATFGFQIISSSSWGAQRIEEILASPQISTVFSAGNGEVEIYEILVPPEWDGQTLETLLARTVECLAVAVTRNGRAMFPQPSSRAQNGGHLGHQCH